jgi:hypothetical protein
MNIKMKLSQYNVFFFFVICLVLAACNLPMQASEQISQVGGAGVEIIYPEDGAKLNAGEMVDIISYLSVPAGGSLQILNINDQPYRTDRFVATFRRGKVYQPWTPPGPGEYALQVVNESMAGEVIISDSIIVHVGEQLVPSFTPTSITMTLTQTPTETPTPTFTPTPTLMTTTPEDALATADTDLNCRYGPGSGYDIADGLREGETSPVIGVNEQRTWYLIAGPHGPTQCWVLAEYITLNRDISQYPVYPAPPLPDIITHTPTVTLTLITPSMTPTNTPGGPTEP